MKLPFLFLVKDFMRKVDFIPDIRYEPISLIREVTRHKRILNIKNETKVLTEQKIV